jgi:SAM-dependent methyltransferase
MDPKAHWEKVYADKGEREVSWFEALPSTSIRMLEAAGLTADSCIIDVGGGDSRLVDTLAARGLDCLVVLDLSLAAIHRAQARLGDRAGRITWLERDVTEEWAVPPMDIWHDRAVFHFLTDTAARRGYVRQLNRTLKPGGSAVIATFALDGPERCSGLAVARYTPETLAEELGRGFRLMESARHEHATPWGIIQSFMYARFLKAA